MAISFYGEYRLKVFLLFFLHCRLLSDITHNLYSLLILLCSRVFLLYLCFSLVQIFACNKPKWSLFLRSKIVCLFSFNALLLLRTLATCQRTAFIIATDCFLCDFILLVFFFLLKHWDNHKNFVTKYVYQQSI